MTPTNYTTAINFDQGEWKLLQIIDEAGHGEGFAGYFYKLATKVEGPIWLTPLATREVAGGPVTFDGKRYSQHAPGTNVFD